MSATAYDGFIERACRPRSFDPRWGYLAMGVGRRALRAGLRSKEKRGTSFSKSAFGPSAIHRGDDHRWVDDFGGARRVVLVFEFRAHNGRDEHRQTNGDLDFAVEHQ